MNQANSNVPRRTDGTRPVVIRTNTYLAERLSIHYEIDPDKLGKMLIAHLAYNLHALTDYSKKDQTEQDLQLLLEQLKVKETEVVNRGVELIEQAKEQLAQAEIIQAEAVKILARYRALIASGQADQPDESTQ